MNLIITIIAVLVISCLFALLAKRLRIPAVVALIIAGLFISFPVIKSTIIEPNTQFIYILGDIGLLCC